MPTLVDKLDAVIEEIEKEQELVVPEDVKGLLETVFKRNDGLGLGSGRRVGIERVQQFLEENGYKYSQRQLKQIARDIFKRRSWGRA